GENDWIIKFANGNLYYWADGKILPESALQKSDKYIRYPINPYNINGRSPESYTEKKIEELRIKKHPSDKKKIVPGEEGSFYKELFGITTKKSSKKQLVEVNLFGYYMTVHYTLAEKIKSIDSKVRQLEKGDTEVRSFLKNIRSVQSFNWRKIAGSGHRSNHSYGIAIDILPKKYNEKTIYWSWEQEKNEDWMLLPQSSLWAPPDSIVKIFLEEKFIWGGHWDRYDTMHFEYRPELIFLFKNIKFDQ
ncbi:MAG TPA: M15 family metallopeptidase, partial [Spirochaetota bacterium]|nr:M15 family metallopeptidase [Spirochaetota bacterium]